jgi:transcriptional regulator with GAF, ATPase, and Fis domain
MGTADLDQRLHAADVEALEQRVMEEALARTGVRNGALFLWDAKADALLVRFHMVEGLVVNLPGARLRRRRDGRPNGIAFWVMDHDAPFLSGDATRDPSYARYYLDVASIAAVPIRYQNRPIGVLSVSSRGRDAFDERHVEELEALAASAAKFLRRAALYRASREDSGRPFLIKGLSPEWLDVERRLELVAPTDAPVLIQGESGTGKELVAHAIHFNSRRSERPFVIVNSAALPETLLESLLFGHARGAFTGATSAKIGELQKAHRGTLFLDEIGELPVALQAKLLRALEYGEVQPLGSNARPERVDVRLICATNRDLPTMVRAARFRDDLYYRVSVVTLDLPPLRQYKDNLGVLAHVFVGLAAERHRVPAPQLSPEALLLLGAYEFPGNVRELKNALEHAVILSAGEEIRPEHLPRSIAAAEARVSPDRAGPTRATLRELRDQWLAPLERSYLERLLAETNGDVRAAARLAGVDAVTLYRLLERRGLGRTRRSRRVSRVTPLAVEPAD